MVIELRGLEFVNKGAELMLYAILQRVREEFPNAVFVMEHSSRAPRNKQRKLGIYTKTNIRKYRLNFERVLGFVPKSIRRKLSFVSEKEVNVVLDGSGFTYGDFWGAKKAGTRLADHVKRWKRRGIKIILLPQALGPFTDAALIEKMKTIVAFTDLIFARDKYSFDYIKEIDNKRNNIYLMPDFTNLISGKRPSYFSEKECEVAIIPNSKLIESGVLDKEKYLAILNQIVVIVIDRGYKPFFLVHEGIKDLRLVEAVNDQYGSNVKIIKEDNPILVKGIIGNSKGVITSRFHGLVSALAQAIPCLCIGWSHKYQALMEDYDYDEGLIKDEELKHIALLEKLELILNKGNRRVIVDKLKMASDLQKARSGQMWEKVFDTVRN